MPGPIPAQASRQVGAIPSGDAATRLYGDVADRPAASARNVGFRYAATDTGIEYQSDGAMWFAVADFGGSGGGAWGDITGTLSDQTDLQAALDLKADAANLTNVDNTSDVNKPVSTATAARFYARDRVQYR